jgi:hypothetical protein
VLIDWRALIHIRKLVDFFDKLSRTRTTRLWLHSVGDDLRAFDLMDVVDPRAPRDENGG